MDALRTDAEIIFLNFNLLFLSLTFKKGLSEAKDVPTYFEITIPSLLYQTFQLLAK